MNIDEAFSSRKSIRDYEKKDVDVKIIGEILDAARKAPSSGNIQNWHTVIVKDQKIKKKLQNPV